MIQRSIGYPPRYFPVELVPITQQDPPLHQWREETASPISLALAAHTDRDMEGRPVRKIHLPPNKHV
jgi:hypothetical protein